MHEETFNRLLDEKMDEMQKIKLILTIYFFKGSNIYPISFIKFRGTLHIFEKRKKTGNILLQKAEGEQKRLKPKLNEITVGNTNT